MRTPKSSFLSLNNAENLLVIADPDLAVKYAQNWIAHRAHSEPYTKLAVAQTHRTVRH